MKTLKRIPVAACLAAALPALAGVPDPADPALPVPPWQYVSAFADYRPLAEPERLDWRAANAGVTGAGAPAAAGADAASREAPMDHHHPHPHHH